MASCRGAVELVGRSQQAEAGIVDDDVGLEPAPGERLADIARRIDARDVHAQHGRPRLAFGGNGVGERGQRLLAPRDQHELVAMAGKFVRQRRPDAGGRAGDDGDGAFLLGHAWPPSRRPATRARSSIRSREEMPSRSAARQIRLLSNSLTWPSA